VALVAQIDSCDYELIATFISGSWATVQRSGITEMADDVKWSLARAKAATEPITDARPIEQVKHWTVVVAGLGPLCGLDHPVLEATFEPRVRGIACAPKAEIGGRPNGFEVDELVAECLESIAFIDLEDRAQAQDPNGRRCRRR
jgi:hypothetical protein